MKDVDQFLKWVGGHVINLLVVGKSLSLYTNFYGERGTIIRVSNNPRHWDGFIQESMMYIVVPEMQTYVGPIHMAELIAHKNSDYKNKELLRLEADMASIPPLPPFMVENGLG